MAADPTVARFAMVMGTVVSVHVLPGDLRQDEVEDAITAAFCSLEDADETFSLWKPDSPMSLVRGGRLSLEAAPPEVAEVIDLCRTAKAISEGWFDPWAIPGGLDPTGLVKGWAAERAAQILAASGVAASLVNAGGDVACKGRSPSGAPWAIGIRHPWRPDALACIVEVDESVATSGCYERGRHLVRPGGGATPPLASATVTGPSLAMADALATGLAVGAGEVLDIISRLDGYEAYLIWDNGSEEATAGMRFVPDDIHPPS
jgi:thiamine biosynthesis lipoprotein